MDERAKQIAALLKTLANENRLMIVCALMNGPMSVGELSKKVPRISQPALSQHLSVLKAHGILDSSRNGVNITYAIMDHRVEEIIHVLRRHYCD